MRAAVKRSSYLKKVFFIFCAFGSVFVILEILSFFALKRFASPNDEVRDAIYFSKKAPHPYLGYVNPSINNVALNLYPNTENQFSVGIFGGSVADQFCQHEERHQKLKKIFEKKTKKSVNIECFAVGGGRQPRQAIAYYLYGGHLNHALFIEGFNELVSTFRYKNHPEYPMTRLASVWYQGFDELMFERLEVYFYYKLHKWGQKESSLNIVNTFKKIGLIFSLQYGKRRLEKLKNSNIETLESRSVLHDVWAFSLNKIDSIKASREAKKTLIIQPMKILNIPISSSEDPSELRQRNFLEDSIKKIKNSRFDELKALDYSKFFLGKNLDIFIDDVHLSNQGIDAILESLESDLERI